MRDPSPARRDRPQTAKRALQWHAVGYAIAAGGLLIANINVGGGWWSFWPTLTWGLVLSVHFFIVRALEVDERWVDQRVDDLHLRSYDVEHIRDIERRAEAGDASVTPRAEQEQ